MADDNKSLSQRGISLFGFEIKKVQQKRDEKEKQLSIVPPVDEDGSGYATASGAHFGQYLNMDGNESKDNAQLIRQYRGVAMHPEVDEAIENIVSEAVTASEDQSSVELRMDEVKVSDNIKKKITEEFEGIVSMLNFNELGHDIFRRWYIDGRIYHHLVVEKGKEKNGIIDIRPIDASKIRKIKEIQTKKDLQTGAKIIDKVVEYFLYQDKPGVQNSGIRLTQDSISYVTSGLLDADRKKVVSYLHKALKPINQLRMMEDSLVIYRLARAPERRIFYIDVGNMPRGKAEQYMKDIMARYRNKIVYDAETGNLKDDRKHMSMLEDFWLPRREGGRGTEISTLPGGDNLGQIDDIIYFQKKVYKALNVPLSRLEGQEGTPFGIGRPSETTRDELKFQKFIDRLRMRFSALFLEVLKRQLILKQIITEDDWDDIKNDMVVNFIRDNFYSELKDSEILRERLQALEQIDAYVGRYYSKEWVQKNVLHLSEEDIKNMDKEMDTEEKEDPDDVPISRLPPPMIPPMEDEAPASEPETKKEPVKEEIDPFREREIELFSEVVKYLKDD